MNDDAVSAWLMENYYSGVALESRYPNFSTYISENYLVRRNLRTWQAVIIDQASTALPASAPFASVDQWQGMYPAHGEANDPGVLDEI